MFGEWMWDYVMWDGTVEGGPPLSIAVSDSAYWTITLADSPYRTITLTDSIHRTITLTDEQAGTPT